MIERMKNEYSCEGEKTRIEIPRTGRITLPINSPILVMYRKENTQKARKTRDSSGSHLFT